MNLIDIPLLIAIAEIKKKASRHGSMSQRWWQNRIYGLQFGTHGDDLAMQKAYILEATRGTVKQLGTDKVSRSAKNNLRGFLNGLRDAHVATDQQIELLAKGGKSA